IVCFMSGNGCGHSVLAAESGTVASQNYPGTYPSNTWCKWRLRVPQGRALRLLFGDFDVESSPGCINGSMVITDKNGETNLGPLCGKLDAAWRNVTFNSNEVTITFKSGPHRSGRGFLLSYATDQHPDLISCLQRGSHSDSQHLSLYCPAGCKNVTGDVWGNSEQGYRDTSVLCKSAIHAGATSDSLGGRITVNRGRSLTLYESTFANGILSKMYVCFQNFRMRDYENVWELLVSSNIICRNFLLWAADSSDRSPWVEVELSDRSTITGIVTTGSDEHYIQSYILFFSKDRKNWKLYKDALSKERKVFQAYTDGHLRVLNSLFPTVVARFVRLQPLSWRGRASAHVQVLGCTVTPRSPRPPGGGRQYIPSSHCLLRHFNTLAGSSQPVIVAVGVALGLIICGSCLLAGFWLKRRYCTLGCQSFKEKSFPCSQSELISYPPVRNVHDALPSPPLNDYAEPALTPIGQKVGSTFKPSSEECYTTPFTCSHYDTPGSLPEYAEPLPPEPEYATPFSEQPSESNLIHSSAHGPPAPAPTSSQYDCPSHRVLFNGYCTPALHANSPRPVSVVYAEPKSCDSLLQKHTYEDPL
uniref:Si:dkey-34d22.1 n=1 Tax=Amphilophus citrinellus TaxID=61819 RepID=A0A3Q0QVA6_AMPCI